MVFMCFCLFVLGYLLGFVLTVLFMVCSSSSGSDEGQDREQVVMTLRVQRQIFGSRVYSRTCVVMFKYIDETQRVRLVFAADSRTTRIIAGVPFIDTDNLEKIVCLGAHCLFGYTGDTIHGQQLINNLIVAGATTVLQVLTYLADHPNTTVTCAVGGQYYGRLRIFSVWSGIPVEHFETLVLGSGSPYATVVLDRSLPFVGTNGIACSVARRCIYFASIFDPCTGGRVSLVTCGLGAYRVKYNTWMEPIPPWLLYKKLPPQALI
ncbi:OLC1v1014025C1 [Oldenlandia corymbosa var. corymbosa]|uniref:OLC1v1014025C1 n=1 Tax=Oldenlandia corymbosa var. corymbosa TaxID=529605 RepID=A0AAV1E282_OLDCO|nr:OLC1v1014025C1 [Oldenlandia corymbosa var. corymbosa]